MLTSQRRCVRGMTLIELMVAVTIAAILFALGAPAFGNWLQSTRIRGTAEAILTGLQTARSEATARNVRVRFQLTSSLDSACDLTTAGRNWVIDIVDNQAGDSPVGGCDAAKSDTVAPSILFTRSAVDGSDTGVVVNATNSSVTFNTIGRAVDVPVGGFEIRVNSTDVSKCRENGGELACLRIRVAPGGQVRMCNAAYPAGDQQACT
jgi:type IV fimbrial biogenesis protein FimT